MDSIVRRFSKETNTEDVNGFNFLRLTIRTIINYLTLSRKGRRTLKFSTKPYNELAYTHLHTVI